MKLIAWRKTISFVLIAAALVCGILSCVYSIKYVRQQRAVYKNAQQRAEQETKKTAEYVNAAFVDQKTDVSARINNVLSTHSLGQQGYWFTISHDGTILTHPSDAFINTSTSAQKQNPFAHDAHILNAFKKAQQGNPSMLTYNNEITGNPSWLFLEPLPRINGVLAGVFDIYEIPLDTASLRHDLVRIIITVSCLFILLLLLSALYFGTNPLRLWLISAAVSLIIAISIGALWYAAHTFHSGRSIQTASTSLNRERMRIIEDKKQLDAYIASAASTSSEKNRAIIPTGIFINDLQLNKEDQVDIVGYLWQRYSMHEHQNITRGIMLPQATTAKIKQIYSTIKNDVEIIIWSVQATLTQNTIYDAYPFDIKNVNITLWPADFAKNSVLTPDFDSYSTINYASQPGVNLQTSIPGWYIEGSYFSYMIKNYGTLFGLYAQDATGIYEKMSKSGKPELTFNITIQRDLINTLVEDLLPLAVILALLFFTFLTTVGQGFAVLASYAAVFFGTVFSQMHFREKIPVDEMVYFETFYFVVYAAFIITVALSIVELTKHSRKTSPIFARICNTAELLFWPSILGSMLLITLFYLY